MNTYPFTIDQLPVDLIARIGDYVKSPIDASACYLAAKCFHPLKQNAVVARFNAALPSEQCMQTLFKRRPRVQRISMMLDVTVPAEVYADKLHVLRQRYGEHLTFTIAFLGHYDVHALLKHVPPTACNVIAHMQLQGTGIVSVPQGVNSLEVSMYVSQLDKNKEVLSWCNAVHITQRAFEFQDFVIDISNTVGTVCLNLETPLAMIHQSLDSKIDVLCCNMWGYVPLDAEMQIRSHYNSSGKRVRVREYVMNIKKLHTEDINKQNIPYKLMSFVDADFVSLLPYGCQPLWISWIRWATENHIFFYTKLVLLCVTKDDYLAARIIQIKTSKELQLHVPGWGGVVDGKHASHVARWYPLEFSIGAVIVTQEEAQRIDAIQDIHQLVCMFSEDSKRLLWEPMVS